ncbi:hypothetical protein IC582_017886 [Cucumis melo]
MNQRIEIFVAASWVVKSISIWYLLIDRDGGGGDGGGGGGKEKIELLVVLSYTYGYGLYGPPSY